VGAAVERVAGVVSAEVNFASGTMVLEYDPATDPRERALEIVRATGHRVEPLAGVRTVESPTPTSWWTQYGHLASTIASGGLLALAWGVGLAHFPGASFVEVALYVLAIATGGWLVVRRAIVSLRARSLDMNVLMTVAVIGAALIGEWAEGALVVFLFAFGGMLESRSLERTRRSIRDLMDLSPPVVRVIEEGREIERLAADVVPGTLVRVRPGERLALDGEVVRGSSALDESPITGESLPVEKGPDDPVWAGSLNTSGVLQIRVTARAQDSTLAHIIYLVEEAQASKAPVQRLVDRFSSVYTPTVIALAACVALVPPIAGMLAGQQWGGFDEWFYRALVMLVVACPCALVISTPVSIVSAITRATRDGVLVKGGAHLETAARVKAVAFDKTGTLTRGLPEVVDVIALRGAAVSRILETAAALEGLSTHPLASAVVRAARGDEGSVTQASSVPAGEEVSGFEDIPGQGVSGVIAGTRYAVVSPGWAAAHGVLDQTAQAEVEGLESNARTVLVVVADGSAIGLIGVADEVRAESPATVEALGDLGIQHVVMITGDNDRTAAAVARYAGVREYLARLLPAEKVDAVRALKDRYGTVVMVGDGINDAPALAAADLGIAMGAAGSDTALQTADVALMSDDLTQVPRFLDLGRRTVRIIKQNIATSIVIKFAVLGLAASGHATLWMAVFADTGVSLLVILNGMRLLRDRRHKWRTSGPQVEGTS